MTLKNLQSFCIDWLAAVCCLGGFVSWKNSGQDPGYYKGIRTRQGDKKNVQSAGPNGA